MKKKQRAALIEELAAFVKSQKPDYPQMYNVLSIEFEPNEDGQPTGFDIPYLPWKPKERLRLPYRIVKVDPQAPATLRDGIFFPSDSDHE